MATIDWNTDVSDSTREILSSIGGFSPTILPEKKELKGWIAGDKEYWDSEYLRDIAAACTEAATWLDNRAGEVK